MNNEIRHQYEQKSVLHLLINSSIQPHFIGNLFMNLSSGNQILNYNYVPIVLPTGDYKTSYLPIFLIWPNKKLDEISPTMVPSVNLYLQNL